jgi:hypothetical protein
MTLLVQKYLETHTLNQLKADHGVNHRVCGTKFSLNYDMLEASETDPLACQCRGTILAALGTQHVFELDPDMVIGPTDIMARTMDRFFNHGQACAAEIIFEAEGTRFYEKLDGTMCALYYDWLKHEWHVSTRSIPEADLPIDGFDNLTFRGLFEKAVLETTGMSFKRWVQRENLHSDMTYVFELCTPANRVVVKHEGYEIHSIAIRHRTGKEENVDDPGYGLEFVPRCRTYELNNLTDMIDFVVGRDPTEYEGIVAVDKHWNRVKVKNPGYLALSRVKDSAMKSPRSLVELCLLGKLDDALPLLPEHIVQRALKIQEALRGFIRDSEGVYAGILARAADMGLDNERKAVALSVQELDPYYMPYVMMRYSGRLNDYSEFIKTQVDSKTGCYKKNFLDGLLEKVEK